MRAWDYNRRILADAGVVYLSDVTGPVAAWIADDSTANRVEAILTIRGLIGKYPGLRTIIERYNAGMKLTGKERLTLSRIRKAEGMSPPKRGRRRGASGDARDRREYHRAYYAARKARKDS